MSEIFEEYEKLKFNCLVKSFAKEANAVSSAAAIDFFVDEHRDAVIGLTDELAKMHCRMCCSKGHEPSYCPFNAQMARAAGKTPHHHAAWVRFRRGRETLIAANRVFEAAKASAAAKKAVSKCKINCATGAGYLDPDLNF